MSVFRFPFSFFSPQGKSVWVPLPLYFWLTIAMEAIFSRFFFPCTLRRPPFLQNEVFSFLCCCLWTVSFFHFFSVSNTSIPTFSQELRSRAPLFPFFIVPVRVAFPFKPACVLFALPFLVSDRKPFIRYRPRCRKVVAFFFSFPLSLMALTAFTFFFRGWPWQSFY